MAFIETPRFPECLRYGFSGGPEFSTDVSILGSGYEQRNKNWVNARGRWSGEYGPQEDANTKILIAYFRAMGGSAHGFRFKDYSDFEVALTEGLIASGIGTGAPTLQLNKKYLTGTQFELRPITKPIAATAKVYKNSVLLVAGYTLDATSGEVTFTATTTKNVNANSAKVVTGITQANPGVVTAVGHGFVTGDKIKLAAVVGMTEVNNLYFTITFISADTFSIGVSTLAYGAYSSGGTATKYGTTQTSPARVYSTAHGFTNGQLVYIDAATGMTDINDTVYTVANASADYFDLSGIDATEYSAYAANGVIGLYPQPADTLTWEGEFDIAARFGSDRLDLVIQTDKLFSWQNVEIVEIKNP
jgi:uncharacterized protein (TIGR02217 family)